MYPNTLVPFLTALLLEMIALSRLKSNTLGQYTNMRGWKTRRKLIVFESDDWGAIRMRDRQTHESLRQAGIPVDRWRYDSLDCLESRADLEALFSVLESHRDSNGQPVKFTLNTVMGNPDFKAIRESSFEVFHHQHFFESYRYYQNDDLSDLWESGISNNLIKPQFHAREHLNSFLWLTDLRDGLPQTRTAFDHEYYGLITDTSHAPQKNYLAAYWPTSERHLESIRQALREGMKMFRKTFSAPALSFVACNYIWPLDLEADLAALGIKSLQGQRGHRCPSRKRSWEGKTLRHCTGQTNNMGQIYTVRNVLFEPFATEAGDCVSQAMSQIGNAFRFNTPAIISSHRVNYSGGMSIKHRERSLGLLNELLLRIRARWPDFQVLSADELEKQIQHDYSNRENAETR